MLGPLVVAIAMLVPVYLVEPAAPEAWQSGHDDTSTLTRRNDAGLNYPVRNPRGSAVTNGLSAGDDGQPKERPEGSVPNAARLLDI